MENNKLINWIFYYSKQDSKVINSEIIIDIESSLLIKQILCSSICYFECGNILFDDFPASSTGFTGIFEYLVNDKGNVMDKLSIDEQRTYINKLTDCNNFSIRHHVSIIKCLMKSYVCQLAPWDRMKRALDALGISPNKDDSRGLATFRYVQRSLIIWLKEAAKQGLLRLLKKTKSDKDAQISSIIDESTLGSLVLYTFLYYAQTKMIKYTVTMPDIDLSTNNNSTKCDLSLEHCRIATIAFADICDNADILPLQMDCLLSRTVDSVPATLIIALVFHWTFGNSLKNLENLLKSSISSSNSNSCDKSPSHRPINLPLHNKCNNSQEPMPFFMNNNDQSSNDGLLQIFSRGKDEYCKTNVNGTSKSCDDGDTSPEIFLTPTEEDIPMSFTNPVTPPIKLLAYKAVETVPKSLNENLNSETISFSLKDEFQRKRKEKQNVDKLKPKVNVVGANETTWLAQSSKNEIMPLTPKKVPKPVEMEIQNNSTHSLTKGQLNDIQIQLSLRRKKIESDKKNVAHKAVKKFENHKQKAFFQAIDKGPEIIRRKSLELVKGFSSSDSLDGDRRSSMFIRKTEKNDVLQTFLESPVKVVPNVADVKPMNIDKGKAAQIILEINANEMEPPQSSQPLEERLLPLQICLEKGNEGVTVDVPAKTESRKDSSPSVSSLSSLSDISIDQNHVTKDEYQKSIDLLSTSLTNLQEEIRFLSQQQLSWNSKITQPLSKLDPDPDCQSLNDHKIDSDNNSVAAETPTNIAISLTEVTELPKNIPQISASLTTTDKVLQRMYSVPVNEMKSVNEISFLHIQSNGNSPSDIYKKIDSSYPVETTNKSSPNDISGAQNFDSRRGSADNTEPNNGPDASGVLTVSVTDPSTEDEAADMSSSSDSVKVANAQPVAFVIAENQDNAEAVRKKAELLAKREQRRLLKLEMFRQRREQDREHRISAANEELLEKEMKKKLEQEKRDSLLKKYLDRRNEESAQKIVSRSASTSGTPVKSLTKSQTLKPTVKHIKQESVENLSLASPQRNGWFSSMRQTHRMTSSSTSQLNTNMGLSEGAKFGVPLPPQEYMGPKLFGKRKVKTNRSVIANAIAHCCLAGSVNIPVKESVLKELAEADGTHFMILFRDSRCQYRSVYVFDLNTEELNQITGTGPKRITHEMVEKFYKYNSGAKQFNPILSTKHLSPAVDAISIQSMYWNARPVSQLLSGAVSTMSISQTKTKR